MTTTPSPVQIPVQPPDDVLAWLRGRTVKELAALEAHEVCSACKGKRVEVPTTKPCEVCEGTGMSLAPRVFFPEALRRRGPDGLIHEEPVYLVIPREDDLEEAQKEATRLIAQQYQRADIDTPAAARTLVGDLRWLSKEKAAIVSLCARSMRPPHIPAYLLRALIHRFDPSVIADMYTRLDTLHRLWDTRVSYLTEEQFRAMASEVARVGNASPFVVLDHALHGPFVTSLAVRLTAFQTCSSCSGCGAHSTPE